MGWGHGGARTRKGKGIIPSTTRRTWVGGIRKTLRRNKIMKVKRKKTIKRKGKKILTRKKNTRKKRKTIRKKKNKRK